MADCNNMAMLLTHLVESDPEYATWAAELPIYKILDNSLIELGGAVDMDRVLAAADTVHANEIILPDVFLNGPATLQQVSVSLKTLHDRRLITKYKLMAVCQGKDAKEFAQTFRELSSIPEIDVIGIPKVCAKLHPKGRAGFEWLWQGCSKKIHLLGLWYSWSELIAYQHPESIRSMDTCMAAYQAKYDMDVAEVRPDGFSISLTDRSISNNSIYTRLVRGITR